MKSTSVVYTIPVFLEFFSPKIYTTLLSLLGVVVDGLVLGLHDMYDFGEEVK